jgi:hypothetical protein
MKNLRIGMTVKVNKDIYRLEEHYELEERNKKLKLTKPNSTTLEEYQSIDWSKWRRQIKLYASEGEKGVIIGTFSDRDGSGCSSSIRLFAKVKIGEQIKTFRFTSLDSI